MSTEVPAGRKYTKEHEWATFANGECTVGITAFAVEQLGDITLVTVDAKPGDNVTAGQAFGTIESVKTLSDLYAPVTGKLVRVNAELVQKPELVNEDCYGKAWMVVIATTEVGGAMMDSPTYSAFLEKAAH